MARTWLTLFYGSSVHAGIPVDDLLRLKGPEVFSPYHRFNTIPKELVPYVQLHGFPRSEEYKLD